LPDTAGCGLRGLRGATQRGKCDGALPGFTQRAARCALADVGAGMDQYQAQIQQKVDPCQFPCLRVATFQRRNIVGQP